METHRAALSTPWCAYVSKASPTQSLSRVNQGTQPCLFSGRGLLSWAQSQHELSCAVSQVTLMRKGISIDRAASVPAKGPTAPFTAEQSHVWMRAEFPFYSELSYCPSHGPRLQEAQVPPQRAGTKTKAMGLWSVSAEERQVGGVSCGERRSSWRLASCLAGPHPSIPKGM